MVSSQITYPDWVLGWEIERSTKMKFFDRPFPFLTTTPPFLFHHPKAVNGVEPENEGWNNRILYSICYYVALIDKHNFFADFTRRWSIIWENCNPKALAFSDVVDVFSIEASGTKVAEELNNNSSLWLRLNPRLGILFPQLFKAVLLVQRLQLSLGVRRWWSSIMGFLYEKIN